MIVVDRGEIGVNEGGLFIIIGRMLSLHVVAKCCS